MTHRSSTSSPHWIAPIAIIVLSMASSIVLAADSEGGSFARPVAENILQETGISGGMVVVVGCGDGRLTAALGQLDSSFLVQGIDTDAEAILEARKRFLAAGLNGRVSAVRFDGTHLPYVDNLVDEETAFRNFDLAETQETLAEQAAHMRGERGAVLWIVRANTGEKIGEMPLDACPVFDGMAAAGERLYVTNQDGSMICLEGE